MDIANNTETKEVFITPDIQVKKHPKSKIIKKIYYIVFIVVFLFGFIAGSGSIYYDSSQVRNIYSELHGTRIPAHEDTYTGWYSLRFTSEGYGWEHNYFYDMGLSDDKVLWEKSEETYSGNRAGRRRPALF